MLDDMKSLVKCNIGGCKLLVQERFHILGCTVGQFPEWERQAKLELTSSFSLLVHTLTSVV